MLLSIKHKHLVQIQDVWFVQVQRMDCNYSGDKSEHCSFNVQQNQWNQRLNSHLGREQKCPGAKAALNCHGPWCHEPKSLFSDFFSKLSGDFYWQQIFIASPSLGAPPSSFTLLCRSVRRESGWGMHALTHRLEICHFLPLYLVSIIHPWVSLLSISSAEHLHRAVVFWSVCAVGLIARYVTVSWHLKDVYKVPCWQCFVVGWHV